MSENKPYPKNVPGDFIVNDCECISCGAPEAEAPDLMTHDDHSCYFKKQPSTPEELERALNAVNVSCVAAVCYVGKDPKILKRISGMEEEHRRIHAASVKRMESQHQSLQKMIEEMMQRLQKEK